MKLKEERLESLKAGIIGSIAFVLSISLVWGVRLLVGELPPMTLLLAGVEMTLSGLTGFLFGVTYRYIIRGDRNSHLQDGAVLAFTLVRTGAFIQQDLEQAPSFVPWVIFGVESFFCFFITRIALDMAIKWQWVKRLI